MGAKDVEAINSIDTHSTAVNSVIVFPNRWSRMRFTIREPAAEFLGTMILVLIGTAGNAQGVLFDSTNVSSSPAGVSEA